MQMQEIMNCDNGKLAGQVNYLRELILGKNSGDYFNVVNLECGTGKTKSTINTLATEDVQCILVMRRIQDCISAADEINSLAMQEKAIAINSETVGKNEWYKIKDNVFKYPVVIITHEKYKNLAINKREREYITKGKSSLIIDEFLNMCKQLSISKEDIYEVETILSHRSLRDIYNELMSELEEYIKHNKGLTLFKSKLDRIVVKEKINRLVTLIQNNELDRKLLGAYKWSQGEIVEHIKALEQFYTQQCVVNGTIIYCSDRRNTYWKLRNNIILDASASLNCAYTLSGDLFKLRKQSRVLSHENWTFNIYWTNSTKSGKARAVDFYDVISSLVTDETLVIGNKQEEDYFKAKYKNHFGNVTGSNEYKYLSNCIIAHTPNIPFHAYAVEYMYYSGKEIDSLLGQNTGSGDNRVFRIVNEEIEKYRQCSNANEIYQAIKRVNRDMSRESVITIFNNDSEIVDKVLRMFNDVENINCYDNIVEFEKSKQEEFLNEHNQRQHENRLAEGFIEFCREVMKDKHRDLQIRKKDKNGDEIVQYWLFKKSAVRDYLGIKDKSNFSKLVLNDADVVEFLQRHKIIVNGQKIDFRQAKNYYVTCV
jgi:hypothetical protein